MKRILVMETGSLDVELVKPKTMTMRTIHVVDTFKKFTGKKVHGAIGGAVKASFQIYQALKTNKAYKVEFLGDFATVTKEQGVKDSEEMMKRNYDVIIMNSMRDVMLVDEYLRIHKNTKVIYTDRGNALINIKDVKQLHPRLPAMYYLITRMKKWLTYYVAITAEQEHEGKRFFTENTKVILIPIAPDKIYRKLKTTKTYDGAICVGRLDERQKRLSFLINGISILKERHPKFERKTLLKIVGKGPHEEMYKSLVQELDLNRNVIFTGPSYGEDLVKMYNNAGFMVTTSKWEGFSRAFLEALACQLPMLINQNINPLVNWEKHEYLIKSGHNGMLYEYDNMEDFIEKFYFMMTNKRFREKLAENGAKTSKQYTLENTVGKYKKIISAL